MNHTNEPATANPGSAPSVDRPGVAPSAAALWASAFVLLALIITQAGKVTGGGSAAMAGNVSTVNDLTVLTASGGDMQDNLILLDRRSERVYVYGVFPQSGQNGVRLLESYDVQEVFTNARNAMGGALNPRP